MSSEIVVKGGSVSLMFDGTILRKSNFDPNVYSNGQVRVTRVQVTDPTGILFDHRCEEGMIVINIEYE